MIGASLYLSAFDINHVHELITTGVKSFFTTVVMAEESYNKTAKLNLWSLVQLKKKYDLILITDISETVFEKLDIHSIEELKHLGFDCVRAGNGFTEPEQLIMLTNHFMVYLNGSELTEKELIDYQVAGVPMDKVLVMYNFYPKPFTALDETLFDEKNALFKRFKLKISAFIPGNKALCGPNFVGLPTLENHRGLNPFVASLDLIEKGVDHIFIGDIATAINDVKRMLLYEQKKVVALPCHLDPPFTCLYNQVFSTREDFSAKLLRIPLKELQLDTENNGQITKRNKGQITLDNAFSNHYFGELNICKADLPIDKSVGIIGSIKNEYIDLLDCLTGGTNICFVQPNE